MNREMITTREETFAPVVGLYEFDTEEEAIEMANDCDVGLGSFIVTESIPRMWRVSEALEVGMVGVNLGLISACEARKSSSLAFCAPFLTFAAFGGVKGSGYGREGGKDAGINEYLQLKTVFINVNNSDHQ